MYVVQINFNVINLYVAHFMVIKLQKHLCTRCCARTTTLAVTNMISVIVQITFVVFSVVHKGGKCFVGVDRR